MNVTIHFCSVKLRIHTRAAQLSEIFPYISLDVRYIEKRFRRKL